MTRATVQRHGNADAGWVLATRPAARAIRHVVPSYVGYVEHSAAPVRRLEVPHPNITLIINLGDPLLVHAPAMETGGARLASFAAGLYDTFVVTEATGVSCGIELNVTPLGMWQLLGVRMELLHNRAMSLEDLLGGDAQRLEDRLRDTTCWDARFDLLDAALTERLAQRTLPSELRWAWDALTDASRPTSVTDLATSLQWSRRRMADTFREYVGMTPKRLSRVIRFDRAVRAVRSTPTVRWSTLALDCGYADQAHLTREFQEFAGLTPTAFLARLGGTGVTAD